MKLIVLTLLVFLFAILAQFDNSPIPLPTQLNLVDATGWTEEEQNNLLASVPKRNQPVVLRGLRFVANWKALTWNPTTLIEKLDQSQPLKNVLINSKTKFLFYQTNVPMVRTNWVRFRQPYQVRSLEPADFLSSVNNPNSSRYVYFSSAVEDFPELKEDLQMPSDPPIPTAFNIWLTSPNVTSQCHFDASPNFFFQISGRKKMILFPPNDWPKLYLYPRLHPGNRQSQIDFDDLSPFPEFKDAHPAEVTLLPGDMLYLPPFWFHHVMTMDPSISISTYSKDEVISSVLSNIYDKENSLQSIEPEIIRDAVVTKLITKLTLNALRVTPKRILNQIVTTRYAPLANRDELLQYKREIFVFDPNKQIFCADEDTDRIKAAEKEIDALVEPIVLRLSKEFLRLPLSLRSLILADFIEELLHLTHGFTSIQKLIEDCFLYK